MVNLKKITLSLLLSLGIGCPAEEAPSYEQLSRENSRSGITAASLERKVEEAAPESKLKEYPLEEDYHYNEADRKKYQGWIDETIRRSKLTGEAVIIIDKADFRLDLYQGGELLQSFPVELGFNPFADKKKQGDGTTPEGKYHVRMVKKRSKFYKAFSLNYPNKEDAKEFRELQRRGQIPRHADIGGGIEIHGHGSGTSPRYGGTNWTWGCIALSDRQIDELFLYVKNGTPVTIVRYDSPKINAFKYVLAPITIEAGSN